jgi:hypothetical protein
MSMFDTIKEKVGMAKGKILAVAGLGTVTLVQYASAATLNESISPILTSVTELFTPLLALIIASVPLIIALAVSILVCAQVPANRVCARHSLGDPR